MPRSFSSLPIAAGDASPVERGAPGACPGASTPTRGEGAPLPGPREPTCQGALAPCRSPEAMQAGLERGAPGTCSGPSTPMGDPGAPLPGLLLPRVLTRGPSAPGSETRGGPRVGPCEEALRLTRLLGEEGPGHDPGAPRSPYAERRLRRPQGAEAPWHDHNLGPGNGAIRGVLDPQKRIVRASVTSTETGRSWASTGSPSASCASSATPMAKASGCASRYAS